MHLFDNRLLASARPRRRGGTVVHVLPVVYALSLLACSQSPAPSGPAPGTGGSGGSSAGSGGRPAGSGGSPGASGGTTGSGGAAVGSGGTASGGSAGDGGTSGGGNIGSGGVAAGDVADAPEETGPTRPAPDGGVPGVGGPVRPCNFAFCESFEGEEGAAPNPAVWTRNNDGLVLSSKMAARGEKSLHVPPMNSGQYFIKENKTFPAMNGEIYGRFFLWIERVPLEKPAGLYHWTFLEGADVDANTQGWVIRLGGHHRSNGASYIRFNINTHTGEGEDGLFDMANGFQPKRWYCIEFYFNTPKSEARFWINGQENQMLHWQKNKAGAYTFPQLKAMRFGWAEYQGTKTPYESYIDEIAMDSHPISCDD